MAKKKYNSVQIRVVNNGWEVDGRESFFYRNDEARNAQDTFVFDNFTKMSKWLEENVKPTGDE